MNRMQNKRRNQDFGEDGAEDNEFGDSQGGGPPNKRGRNGQGGSRDTEHLRKIFIGGLSANTTEESLKSHFEEWGEIVDCVVMRDPNSKRSRGFGFITYKHPEDVDKAQENRPHNLDGKDVETKRATPREESSKPESRMSIKKVFVGGIKDEIEQEHLEEYFSQFGSISSVDVITDKATNKKRGFAFITYDDYDPVDKVVLEKSHFINGRRCDVKKALSKDELEKAKAKGGYGGGMGRGGGYGGDRGNRDRYMGGDSDFRGGRGNFNSGGNQGNYNQGGGGGQYSNQGGNFGNQGMQGGGGGGYNQQQSSWGNQGGGGGGGSGGGGNWGNQNQGGGGYNQGGFNNQSQVGNQQGASSGGGGNWGSQSQGNWGGNQASGGGGGGSSGGGGMNQGGNQGYSSSGSSYNTSAGNYGSNTGGGGGGYSYNTQSQGGGGGGGTGGAWGNQQQPQQQSSYGGNSSSGGGGGGSYGSYNSGGQSQDFGGQQRNQGGNFGGRR